MLGYFRKHQSLQKGKKDEKYSITFWGKTKQLVRLKSIIYIFFKSQEDERTHPCSKRQVIKKKLEDKKQKL